MNGDPNGDFRSHKREILNAIDGLHKDAKDLEAKLDARVASLHEKIERTRDELMRRIDDQADKLLTRQIIHGESISSLNARAAMWSGLTAVVVSIVVTIASRLL